jgi:hypothetical protein
VVAIAYDGVGVARYDSAPFYPLSRDYPHLAMMRFHFPHFGLLLALGMLAGCWSNPIERLSPYKVEIQQGKDRKSVV